MAVPGKGLLAADESTGTIEKRFNALNIPCSQETRRAYRELLLTTPNLEQYVSGVILFEETLYQNTSTGVSFIEILNQKNIIPGIKVDKGLVALTGTDEKVTQGLDGLADRLQTYKNQGARFAKWRAVFSIGQNTPSRLAIKSNAIDLARYAAICQRIGIVPIVEPEVLIDGDHSIETCFTVSEKVLHSVFHQLFKHNVILECMILKPSMVTPGKESAEQVSANDIAQATLAVLRRSVPAAVPSINFLSGGQTPIQATENLNQMHQLEKPLPWNVSFSFARALQEPCMQAWLGKKENTTTAQQIFAEVARANSFASRGEF